SPLAQATGTLTTTTAGVTIADGGVFGIPTLPPGSLTTIKLPVSLALTATAVTSIDLAVNIQDPEVDAGGAARRLLPVSDSIRVNTDEIAASSATDDVEGDHTVWTAFPHGNDPWVIALLGTNRVWFAPDPDRVSDESLVSPPLMVGAGALTVAFDATWDEEIAGAPAGQGFDGVVIEVS